MAYARIPDELGVDDRYLEAIDACSAAGTLVLLGYSYAAREASDGHVPRRQLRRMLDDPDETERAIDALVTAGLWERTDDGVQMLDYLHAKRNMTRAEWEAKRETERIRKAEWRAGQRRIAAAAASDPDPDPPGVSQRDTAGTDAGRDAGQTADGTPDGGRPSLAREGAPSRAQTLTQIPKGSGGGERASADEPVDSSDVTPLHWAQATAALVNAGIDRSAIEAHRADLAAELTANPRTIEWPAAGRWLAAKRRAGDCSAAADQPVAALRFVLRSPSAPVPGGRRRPGQRNPQTEPPANTLTDAEAADLMARITADARQHIGDDAWDTWLSVIQFRALSDGDLWLTAPDHARDWIERRLMPLLRASAERVIDRPMTARLVGGRVFAPERRAVSA